MNKLELWRAKVKGRSWTIQHTGDTKTAPGRFYVTLYEPSSGSAEEWHDADNLGAALVKFAVLEAAVPEEKP